MLLFQHLNILSRLIADLEHTAQHIHHLCVFKHTHTGIPAILTPSVGVILYGKPYLQFCNDLI